jgi:anti-sigma B factor antagonist
MTSELLTIKHETMDNYHIVRLAGELDASTSKNFDTYISDLYMVERKSLLIDMGGVGYISSAGIGVLIFYYGELSKQGMKVVLAQTTAAVYDILTLLRLEDHIPMVDTVEQASLLF